MSIILLTCCQPSNREYVSGCDDISLTKYNLNSQMVLKSKLYIYYLNDKYKMPFLLKNQAKTDTIPFNRSKLCVSIRSVRTLDGNEYMLSFKSYYNGQNNQSTFSFFQILLDYSFKFKNVEYDVVTVPIESIGIDRKSAETYKQKILSDSLSDKWLLNNIDSINLIVNRKN
jgi:hypothetical protein